jgi:signal transduction histidine kinase
MSLRLKLTLILMAIVTLALAVVFYFTRRHVIQPFTKEVIDVYLDEMVYVADQIRAGADPAKLGKNLRLDIRVLDRAPPWFDDARCQKEERKSYPIIHCRGPRAAVSIETDKGFVVVRRNLDINKPGKRAAEVLVAVGACVFILCAGVAILVTRPLKTTTDAMGRIAAGDLAHRLPVTGGKELAETARMFNAMADKVDRLLRAERELMAGISHELRTPLARLRLETELLKDLEGAPEKRLNAMESDLVEIDELIGELLECSRLSLGDRSLARQQVDLRKVVEEALERHPLPEHKVVVEGQSAPITGDHTRLVRVVGNLLQNAGKYAPPGTDVQVVLRGTEVEVRDRGPGVAPEELGRVFEPFYRGQDARTASKPPGLGLGLMIARQIVTLHGGEIEAQNRDGGGLSIRFRLLPST